MAKAIYREPAYRAALAYWTTWMATKAWTCRRCGHPIPPGRRDMWDLGHPDHDDALEPEHRTCNRAAGARVTNAHRKGRPTRDWW